MQHNLVVGAYAKAKKKRLSIYKSTKEAYWFVGRKGIIKEVKVDPIIDP